MDYYSPNSCRNSGNRCGWFSRNVRNGVLIALFFGMLISSVPHLLSSMSFAFALTVYLPSFDQMWDTIISSPDSYDPSHPSVFPSSQSMK